MSSGFPRPMMSVVLRPWTRSRGCRCHQNAPEWRADCYACAGDGSIQWFSKRILSDVGADISQADDSECASQASALPFLVAKALSQKELQKAGLLNADPDARSDAPRQERMV